MRKNKHIGSEFDDFLESEGILATAKVEAIKRVISFLLQQKIDDGLMTKTQMAEALETSRSGLSRILDPENTSMTLTTLVKAAHLAGKNIRITFEDDASRHI
ncbi:MAG: Fis family transcriptional regulator [Gammaproteobacteria bacterium]